MITSLQRTRQTAEVLFPDAELVVADGLKEMDFGVFEGRNYREMEHDPQYRAWVETGCEGRCPGGESKAEFCQRVCTAFAALVDAALAAGEPQLVIVAHGGTQMAALERFAVPHKNLLFLVCSRGGRLCAGCRRLDTPENPARGQNRAVYKGVTMLICWAVLGGFVLDAIFGDPAAAASRCADGQSHHRAGKTPARTISPNAAGGALRRGGAGRRFAGGHVPHHSAGVQAGGGAAPAGGACRADVLVRPGIGR